MIKFIKSLFAPVVKVETPVVEEVKAVEAPAKKPRRRRITPVYNQLGQVVTAEFEDVEEGGS